jgi:hypothetical protein
MISALAAYRAGLLTKTNNVAILIHGVSLSLRGSGRLDTRLDTPPISLRHHPGSGLAPIPRETSHIASYDLRISTMGYSNGWDGTSQDSRVKLRELYFC